MPFFHDGSPRPRARTRLLPFPAWLLAGGHGLILLASVEYYLRLQAGYSHEHLLYLEDFAHSVGSAAIFLWLTALGLDLLVRRYAPSPHP